MSITSYVAASRQIALQHALENTAYNLASQGIPGFQNNMIVFQSYLKNDVSYVEDKATIRDLNPGAVIQTGDPLHVSINGSGYFAIQDRSGNVEYTRGGAFHLDSERYIVTPQGDYVLDDGLAPIQIPETAETLIIGKDATLSDQQMQLAKIGIFMFDSEQDMKPSASGYLTTDQSPQALESPNVVQGAYEGSNVNSILEATNLTSTLREYQQNMKFIEEDYKTESEATQRLVKLAPSA